MLLQYKLDDTINIEGTEYTLNLAFDNVLRVYDVNNDTELDLVTKVDLGLYLLLGKPPAYDNDGFLEPPIESDVVERLEVYTNLINQLKPDAEEAEEVEDEEEFDDDYELPELPKLFDLEVDADYIFAGFMQAYGIDLIEEQGKLHWYKFNALLNGMPEGTRFSQVVGVRAWKKPSKSDTHEKVMYKLQQELALPTKGEEDDV